MSLTRKEMLQALIAGAGGTNQDVEGQQQRQTDQLKNYLQGQAESGRQKQGLDTLKKLKSDPSYSKLLNEGGSLEVDPATGTIKAGGNPLITRGPQQGEKFLQDVKSAYKGIHDTLDASKATLDNLDLGNTTGDQLARINEAKLSLAGTGGRAIGQMVSHLSGDPTMASDAQKTLNWLQNTPNIPKMQDAERDAMREAVFGRLDQTEQMHNQTKAQLLQQGAVVAPQSNPQGLVDSLATPAAQKLQSLRGMQQEYKSRKSQLPGGPVSNPSVASPNPTTFDKLKSFLGFGQSPQQAPAQPAPAAPQGTGVDPDEFQNFYNNVYKKMKNAPAQPPSPTGPDTTGQ